ncbi:MAG: T9SS type A sorting domain-containing protein [Flavobacteriales bacterium]|nr:T9SS type A sorting domain-containing protein [Flavobacteriales bacterium]
MRQLLLAFLSLPFSSHAQNWHWATALLGTGQPQVKAVAALEDGGALVCGIFNDTLRAGNDTIITHGDWDGFLARLNGAGDVLWLKAIGNANFDELHEIVVDDAGNGFATGTFSGTVDWNGSAVTGNAGREGVLVKFDLDGELLWFRRANGYSTGYTVSVSEDGVVYWGGLVNTSVSFGSTTVTNTNSLFNTYVARYTAGDGTLLGAQRVTSSSGESGAYGMDVDSEGDLYLTGYNRPQQNPYVGSYMGKVSYSGGTSWTQTVASAFGDVYGRDVSVTNDGHVYFTGNIYNNLTFIDAPIGQFGRYKNAYLARFSSDGTLDFVQQYGSTSVDEGLAVVCDGLNNAYWTGRYTGPVAFDTITVNAIGISTSQDIFVARTEPTGGVAWVSRAGGAGLEEFGTAMDKQENGPLIIGGQYTSYYSIFGTDTLPPPNGQRCFVASMGVPDDELTTALNEPAAPLALRIHPVPTQDHLFVALEGGRGASAFEVLDASGRMVLSSTLRAPLGTIDVHALAEGSYILRMTEKDGQRVAKRFVVQR